MKNILLTLVLVLTVSFAFAGNEIEKASVVEVEETVFTTNEVNRTISIELLEVPFLEYNNLTSSTDYISCRYRKCIIFNGEKYCTEWKPCKAL